MGHGYGGKMWLILQRPGGLKRRCFSLRGSGGPPLGLYCYQPGRRVEGSEFTDKIPDPYS